MEKETSITVMVDLNPREENQWKIEGKNLQLHFNLLHHKAFLRQRFIENKNNFMKLNENSKI